jgi:hypothetical protein
MGAVGRPGEHLVEQVLERLLDEWPQFGRVLGVIDQLHAKVCHKEFLPLVGVFPCLAMRWSRKRRLKR